MKKSIGKKILYSIVSCFMIISQVTTTYAAPTNDQLGSVNMNGNPSFDSDELFDDSSYNWHWLSTVDSRMVLLPNQNLDNKDFHLDFDLFVHTDDKKIRHFQSVKLAGETANEMKYHWKPYGIQYNSQYNDGKSIDMMEFFTDKDTFIRYFDVKNAKDKEISFDYDGEFEHGGTKDDVEVSKLDDNSILMDGPDFYFVSKVMLLDENSKVTNILEPSIDGKKWSVKTNCSSDSVKLAVSVTLAVKPDDTTSQTVIERANNITVDTNIDEKLKTVKDDWNARLAKVPEPTVWGIQAGLDTKGVTEKQHKQSFYAAWAFNYQNIMEPVHENGYNHRQVTLGKPSGYTSGPDGAINSCSWESFYDIQQLAYVEPDIAWDAVKGFIESIPDSGKLSGESLPSQKAHTVWVCYQNKPDNEALKELYPKIKAYLKWRAENPHWIIGGREYKDEKDISFVTQWYSDVNYAIKICEVLDMQEDIAMWENMKLDMAEKAREWFFAEDDKVHNWYFSDSGKYYDHDRNADVDNYIISALNAEFPKDMMDRIVDHFLNMYDKDADLLGLDFYKYGDGCQIAYGLFEKESQYSELKGVWKEQINSVLRHIVKTGEFCEECKPNEYETSGVAPSTFTASAMIDFTYMNNGIRIDEGKAMMFDGINDEWILKENDLEFATLQNVDITLPKTVQIVRNDQTVDAYVVWQDTDKIDVSKAGDYSITGKVSSSDLTVKATVHVYGGNLNYSSINLMTTENKEPKLPESLPVTYTINNKTYYGYTDVAWEKKDSSEYVAGKDITVQGTLQVNQQDISATVQVVDISIKSATDSFEVNQGESLTLSVENKTNEEVTVKEWKVKDSGYDNAIGINQSGKLIGVKAGTATVVAVLDNGLELEKDITVKGKNAVTLTYGSQVETPSNETSISTGAEAVDEDLMTKWRSNDNNNGQIVTLELPNQSAIEGMNIVWYRETSPSKYKIEISNDKENWTEIYTHTGSFDDKGQDYSDTIVFDNIHEAKYIRIVLEKAGSFKPGILEIRAYGSVLNDTEVQTMTIQSQTGAFNIDEKAVNLPLSVSFVPEGVKDQRVEWSITDKDGHPTDIADITATGEVVPYKDGEVIVTATSITHPNVRATQTVTITNQSLINVALNQEVSATTEASDNQASHAVDGDRGTRWGSTSGAPQSSHFTIYFDQTYEISSAKLYFENAYPVDYKIQYSDSPQNIAYDKIEWKDLETVTGNKTQNVMYTFDEPVNANYVRIISSKTSNRDWCYSIYEFEVYGKEANKIPVEEIALTADKTVLTGKGEQLQIQAQVTPINATNQKLSWHVYNEDGSETTKATISDNGVLTAKEDGVVKVVATSKDGSNIQGEIEIRIRNQNFTNIALEKDVQASSNKNDGGTDKSKVVDGDKDTRWSSDYNDNEYITIDLGDLYYANQVILNWEASYGKEYKILTSIDGENWTELYHETNSDGGIDSIVFDQTITRYVKMQGIRRSSDYGYSLYEFEVYGKALKADLRSLYDEYKDIQADSYTPNSYSAFNTALDHAKDVLENAQATENDVQEAYNQLEDAKTLLAKQADKEALGKAIEKANSISEGQYTPNSVEAFQKIVAQVQVVYDDKNATQNEVDAAVATLTSAQANLVERADNSALKAAIDNAKGIDKGLYTPSSVEEFNKVISEAEKVLANGNATEDEIANAINSLTEAYGKLEARADNSQLETLIEEVKGTDKQAYTSVSYQALQVAIEEAKKVLNDPEATEEEINAAIEKVNQAKNGLAEVQRDPLKDVLFEANAVDQTKYTDTSLKELETAIKNAEAALKTTDQKKIDEAYAALKKAYEGLEEKEENTTKPEEPGESQGGTEGTTTTKPDDPNQDKPDSNKPETSTKPEVTTGDKTPAKPAETTGEKTPNKPGEITVEEVTEKDEEKTVTPVEKEESGKQVKTSDEAPIMLFTGVGMVSLLGVLLMRKKKNS